MQYFRHSNSRVERMTDIPSSTAPPGDPTATACFLAAPLPANEDQRLKSLHSYGILDTTAEQSFDDIAGLAALLCDAPIALISLVDRERQWFKAHIGIAASEPRATSPSARTPSSCPTKSWK
jgi:hypothetical protein